MRLIQAGVRNVIAIGGAKIGEDIARLLKAHGITEITYIPDVEYKERGERKTKITADAIRGGIRKGLFELCRQHRADYRHSR